MIFQTESYRRGIVLSSAFNLVSRLLLFGQSIVIAHYFPSEETDVFFFCFSTTVLLALLVNGLDYTLIIPEWTRLLEFERVKIVATKYVNGFLAYYFLTGFLFFLLISFFPRNTLSFCSEFDLSMIERNLTLVRLFGPLLGLMIMTSLMANILVANKYFTLPSVISAINSLLAIASTTIFHGSLGALSIVLGLNFSYCLNLVLLVVLMRKGLKWNFALFDLWPKREVLRKVFAAQLGHLASFSSSFVPLYLLSGLDKGIITALIFGQRTAEIPSQLLVNQFSVVTGIKFNELSIRDSKEEIRDVFNSAVDLLIYLTIPIALLSVSLAPEIIDLFYGSGTFTVVQVLITAKFLQLFVIALPLLAINTLCVRLFMSARLLREILIYQLALNGLLIGMTYLLVSLIGPLGYPAAYVTAYALVTLIAGYVLGMYFPLIGLWSSMRYFGKVLIVNGLVISITTYISSFVNWSQNFMEIVGVTMIYIVVLLSFTHVFALNRNINRMVSYLRARVGI